MFRLIILIIMSAMVTTGCATVNRGADDHFRIDTVPQGAKITTSIETSKSKRKRRKNKNIAPEYKGCNPTPCAIQLSRLSEFTFTVEHTGYEPVEMYVTNSNKIGSFTANTTATAATTAGTVAVGAVTAAGLTAIATGIGTGIVFGTGAGLTFGLVPIQTAVSTGLAAGASAAPSAGSLVVGAIPPALAVTGGMLLIDAGTGANRNLYPNPVVLELTPEGLPVKYDPAVNLYKEKKVTEERYQQKCRSKPGATQPYKKTDECRALRLDMLEKRKALKTLITPPKTSNNSNTSTEIAEPK